MEFQNYERELKYLLTEGKLSLEELLKYLQNYGYVQVDGRHKEKHESYYDDKKFSIINRGDVLRGSKHITDGFEAFMYKKNMSDPNKPYVSKLELGTGQFKTKYRNLQQFVADLDLGLDVLPDPILYAKLSRDTAVVEKHGDKLLLSYDTTKYYQGTETDAVSDIMLEVEDWDRPNTTNVRYDYDASLLEINELLLRGDLPLDLTKHTKPYRGCEVLGEKGRES